MSHTNSMSKSRSILSLIHDCSSTRRFKQIHAKLVTTNMIGHGQIVRKAIEFLTNSSNIDYASNFLNYLPPHTPSFPFNSIIASYADSKTPEQAILVYKRLSRNGSFSPDMYTFPVILKSCCKLLRTGEGRQFHGSLGCTPNIQIKGISSGILRPVYAIRPWGRQNALPFTGLILSRRSMNSSNLSCAPSSEIKTTSNANTELEGEKSATPGSQLNPSSFQVESLLSEICDTATIAEFELKFGEFRLYVTRDLAGKHNSSSPPTSTPVSSNMNVQAPDSNGSVSAHSLAISKPEPSGESRTLREEATDKGLRILNSPRVGFFRRSRTIKGKRAAPPCKENQTVKEGQVLCYIEQLGGEIPIESDVAGEVVKILKKDGEPVGYGDALMEILPSFPGIKKLQ